MPHNPAEIVSGAPSAVATAPSSRHAWYTVLLLCVLYTVSMIDRSILALLAQPVSQSLGLDDRQMALLLGLGFALFYAVGGIVLGHFVDTRNRRVVATCGIMLWSVATITSAFATDYWTLMLLRSGVALGEAVLMPTAISLIADLFPPDRRGLPVASFTSVGSAMAYGSYLFGAAAISLAGVLAPASKMAVWQLTLIIVGVPGLALALIFALSAKVPMHRHASSPKTDELSISALFVHLKARGRFLLPLLSLNGFNGLFGLAIVIWLPTVLIREHGVSAAEAGYLVGLVGVPTGLAGNFFWQWLSKRTQIRDPHRGLLRVLIAPALLVAPIYVVGLLANSLAAKLGCFGVGMFLSTGFNVLTPIAIQFYVPAYLRARMITVSFLILSVLGNALGPMVAVELGLLLSHGTDSLRLGLVACTVLTWPFLMAATLMTIRNVDAPGEA